MTIHPKLKNSRAKLQAFYYWLKQSTERLATAILVAVTVLICALLLLLPKHKTASGHEHGHGEGAEEHEEEQGIELDDDVLEAAGMTLEQVKSETIRPKVAVRGEIVENANQSMNVKPRFSGIARSVFKDFGDSVKKGDALLSIESASTRSSFTVRTAIDGIVADKNIVVGAFIPEGESVFRVVNLDTVWFQGKVNLKDAEKIQVGLDSEVLDRLSGSSGTGKTIYVSPVIEEDTQSRDVKIQLSNQAQNWKIGSFAEGNISLQPVSAKLAVRTSAVQVLESETVVFKRKDDMVIAVPVTIGKSDNDWTEVSSGDIAEGDSYVSTNSFLAKAELLKSLAGHDH